MIRISESQAKEVLQSYNDYVSGVIDEFPYSFTVFRAAQNFMDSLTKNMPKNENPQGQRREGDSHQ